MRTRLPSSPPAVLPRPSCRLPAFPALRFASYQQPDRPGAPVIAEEGAKAKALLDQVIAAKGGLATLRGIKTIKAVTSTTMTLAGGPGLPGLPGLSATSRPRRSTYLQYPDHVRVETKAPQGLQIQIYDGEHGWVRDPGGVHDVPEVALQDMAASLKRDTMAALLAADRGELRARLLPDVKDAAAPFAMRWSCPALRSSRSCFTSIREPASSPSRRTWFARPGQPLIEELFSDYRLVDGVNVAFTAEVRAAGKSIVKRRLNADHVQRRARSQAVYAPTD